jgi:hypothetical protein
LCYHRRPHEAPSIAIEQQAFPHESEGWGVILQLDPTPSQILPDDVRPDNGLGTCPESAEISSLDGLILFSGIHPAAPPYNALHGLRSRLKIDS